MRGNGKGKSDTEKRVDRNVGFVLGFIGSCIIPRAALSVHVHHHPLSPGFLRACPPLHRPLPPLQPTPSGKWAISASSVIEGLQQAPRRERVAPLGRVIRVPSYSPDWPKKSSTNGPSKSGRPHPSIDFHLGSCSVNRDTQSQSIRPEFDTRIRRLFSRGLTRTSHSFGTGVGSTQAICLKHNTA